MGRAGFNSSSLTHVSPATVSVASLGQYSGRRVSLAMDGIQGLISIRQRPLSLQVSVFNTQERVRPRHSESLSGIQLKPPRKPAGYRASRPLACHHEDLQLNSHLPAARRITFQAPYRQHKKFSAFRWATCLQDSRHSARLSEPSKFVCSASSTELCQGQIGLGRMRLTCACSGLGSEYQT